MDSPTVVHVPVGDITVTRRPTGTIAVVGIPNSGKSTLFNRLTGLRQRTANYPGVTVEKHVGTVKFDDQTRELIDLPGTHALNAQSLEERIAVDVVLGRMAGTQTPAGILAVVDATHLYQGLYLIQQLMELELPMVVALTMMDAAAAGGLLIDVEALQAQLGGVRVCPVVATSGRGMDELKKVLATLPDSPQPERPFSWPELSREAEQLAQGSSVEIRRIEIELALLDGSSPLSQDVLRRMGKGAAARLEEARERLFDGEPPLAEEARHRYRWVRSVLAEVQSRDHVLVSWTARAISRLNRPLPATLGFFVVMAVVFQAVFAWATPMTDGIDSLFTGLGSWAAARLPEGALSSLVVDGVIAGVGSVLVFLPQIMILFLFIILLEDSGYLARAAYLMDRLMRIAGLSGQSVIPMVSSFACAVPGIMATRVIPNRRDRIATIMAAPFMTCSARLPIYALLIAAFVPATSAGWLNLQGIVLFGLYLLGIVGGILTALLLRRSALRGPKPAFALTIPEFRRPNLRTVSLQLLARARIFLRRAGTVIFAVAVIVWALAYFPRSDEVETQLARAQAEAEASLSGPVLEEAMRRLENEAAAEQLARSWLGRAGRAVEPAFRPLGWDWRVSAAVIAGFPAREVVVAVLGTIYAVGAEAEDTRLAARLRQASWPDGTRVFTLPMVLGMLLFYAWCLQCAATIAIIRRETNSWRWPLFAWAYMTTLGYLGALAIFQLGSRMV